MKCAVIVLLLIMLFGGIAVRAQTVDELYTEQLEASGGRDLIEQLPPETQELLDDLGIREPDPHAFAELKTETVAQRVLKMAAAALRGPLATAGTVLLIVLLYAWLDGLRQTLRSEETTALFGTVCSLAISGAILLPLTACIENVNGAMQSVSVFMGSFTPAYAAILLSGGHAATALSFQSVVLYVSQMTAWLASSVIVPLMTASLALGVTGAVTPQVRLSGVGRSVGKVATWLLSLGMLLFTGLLSLQSLAGGAADNLGSRALRFSLSSFVPVVGGALGETFGTIRGCLQLLRSTVGGFGALATVLIILPPLLQCIGWCVVLWLCRTATELFDLKPMTDILEAARGTVKCLIGVLSACGSFLIVAVTVVTAAAGG